MKGGIKRDSRRKTGTANHHGRRLYLKKKKYISKTHKGKIRGIVKKGELYIGP